MDFTVEPPIRIPLVPLFSSSVTVDDRFTLILSGSTRARCMQPSFLMRFSSSVSTRPITVEYRSVTNWSIVGMRFLLLVRGVGQVLGWLLTGLLHLPFQQDLG